MKRQFAFNQICRDSPASLAASAAEDRMLDGHPRRKGNAPARVDGDRRTNERAPKPPRGPRPDRRREDSRPVSTDTAGSALSTTRNEARQPDLPGSQPGPSGEKPKRKTWSSRFGFPLPELGEPGGLDDPYRKSMNGSTTKRYLIHLNAGKSREEARDLACAGSGKNIEGARNLAPAEKRGSALITPPEKSLKKPRFSDTFVSQKRSFAKAAETVKLAIIAEDHPETILSSADLGQIQDYLLDEMLSSKSGESIKFGGIQFGAGKLLLDCGNEATANWVRETTPQLKEWKGAKLWACSGDDIPHDHIMKVFLPRSEEEDVQTLLRRIQVQNRELNVGCWKVLSTNKHSGGQLLRVVIDDHSKEEMVKKEYLLNFRFGAVPTYGLKRGAEAPEPIDDEPSAPSETVAEEDCPQEATVTRMEEEEEALLLSSQEEVKSIPQTGISGSSPNPASL